MWLCNWKKKKNCVIESFLAQGGNPLEEEKKVSSRSWRCSFKNQINIQILYQPNSWRSCRPQYHFSLSGKWRLVMLVKRSLILFIKSSLTCRFIIAWAGRSRYLKQADLTSFTQKKFGRSSFPLNEKFLVINQYFWRKLTKSCGLWIDFL